jgi:hypothetical protein
MSEQQHVRKAMDDMCKQCKNATLIARRSVRHLQAHVRAATMTRVKHETMSSWSATKNPQMMVKKKQVRRSHKYMATRVNMSCVSVGMQSTHHVIHCKKARVNAGITSMR